jgi:hypothetical protein
MRRLNRPSFELRATTGFKPTNPAKVEVEHSCEPPIAIERTVIRSGNGIRLDRILVIRSLHFDLCAQFDDAIRRNMEILYYAAGIAHHSSKQAFSPHCHADTRYCNDGLPAQEERSL